MKKEERNHEYIHRTISQPVDHSDPEGMSFKQHVDIIIPEGCSSSAPVFFHLGEEHELEATDDGSFLIGFYYCRGQAYLGAVSGRLVVNTKVDVSGRVNL